MQKGQQNCGEILLHEALLLDPESISINKRRPFTVVYVLHATVLCVPQDTTSRPCTMLQAICQQGRGLRRDTHRCKT